MTTPTAVGMKKRRKTLLRARRSRTINMVQLRLMKHPAANYFNSHVFFSPSFFPLLYEDDVLISFIMLL
jgi:hypothetical protein